MCQKLLAHPAAADTSYIFVEMSVISSGVTVHGPAGSSDGVGRLAKWAMRV